MITLYLNANHNEVTLNKKNYLLKAAYRMGLQDYVLDHTLTPEVVPDYILNIEPYSHIVTGKKWSGVWEIDVLLDRSEMNIGNWPSCDTIFLANNSQPSRVREYGGNKIVMFQACDPELHRRIYSIEPQYDFVFSGTNGLDIYRERERTMDVLKNAGFSFHDFGKNHPPEKYVEYINQARVQFCRSGGKHGVADSQVEQRFFECLAVGPVLKDYHPDLEKLGLEEGVDFYWFKDDEEMKRKMKYLVDNPVFAKEMAANGRNKALMFHTYEHRLISILKYADEHSHSTT